MSGSGQLIQVEIFGQTYRLRAEDDPEYVSTLAEYVDGKMQDVARQTKAVDSLRVAVLAALNIADEHLRAQRRAAPAREASPARGPDPALGRRAEELVRILDEALAD